MDKVFVYWDNSNIFISAQQVAAEREGDSARYRVRLHFRQLLEVWPKSGRKGLYSWQSMMGESGHAGRAI